MALPDRNVLFGMALGALSATALGTLNPGWVVQAFAEDQVQAFNPANLAIFSDQAYSVHYDDSVSTEPVSQATVRKIAGGKTSIVSISTTATGTYSSEALFSPHVLYPGITVKRLPYQVGPVQVLASWGPDGWVPLDSGDAQSILTLVPDQP